MSETKPGALDAIHHVAVPVENVGEAVRWYTGHFRCSVSYEDSTWALLEFENTRLALVVPEQHPPHIGFEHPHAEEFGPLTRHRDGTRSIYLKDPSGNSIEILDAASTVREDGGA